MKVAEAKAVHQQGEIADAIRALTPADWIRLRSAAGHYAWAYHWGPEDLLQESFRRMLAGSRQWPAEVDLVHTLREAMRSIANGESEKIENQAEFVPVEAPGAKIADSIEVPSNEETPEEEMMIAQEEKALRSAAKALFPEDLVAQDVIDGILSGFEGEELQELTDLNPTSYATKRRLIRRTLNQLIPKQGEQ